MAAARIDLGALIDAAENERSRRPAAGLVTGSAAHCSHENETAIQAGDYLIFCPDCGKTREIGEGYST